MIPCVSPGTKVRYKALAIVVSNSRRSSNSQSIGSSAIVVVVSPKNSTTWNTMAGVDSTMRMFVFSGARTKNPDQHIFLCEVVWAMKNIQDDDMNIA
jgi:hypothetical protein